MPYSKISDKYEFGIYRVTEIHDVPEMPGMYSWHLICLEDERWDYHTFFKQITYDIHLKNFLGDEYKGEVSAEDFRDLSRNDTTGDEFMKLATAFFSPPIYIGISEKDVSSRLSDHKRILSEIINKGRVPNSLHEIFRERAELKYQDLSQFAERAGELVIERELFERNFLIKVINFKDGNSYRDAEFDIKELEYFLNRTFIPLLGRL